jgi:hypothetical protein
MCNDDNESDSNTDSDSDIRYALGLDVVIFDKQQHVVDWLAGLFVGEVRAKLVGNLGSNRNIQAPLVESRHAQVLDGLEFIGGRNGLGGTTGLVGTRLPWIEAYSLRRNASESLFDEKLLMRENNNHKRGISLHTHTLPLSHSLHA